jgi:hypothetical protein
MELARHVTASKGMNVGNLLASWHRNVSPAVQVAHPDNVLGREAGGVVQEMSSKSKDDNKIMKTIK